MPRIENIGDNWFDRQIISTCNWDSSNKVSMYLSGFLNLQIEHHVAPQMPPEHYRYIRKNIMEFAKKRKLPYYDFTFLQGLCLFVSTLKDTAKVLTEYVDIVMLRTSSHKNLEEFGKYLGIPIINGLSDLSHPCQIMSDILTYEESNGSITGKTVSWLGDGNNNMSNSLIEAAGKFDFNLKILFKVSSKKTFDILF